MHRELHTPCGPWDYKQNVKFNLSSCPMNYKDQTVSVYVNWSFLFDHRDACVSCAKACVKLRFTSCVRCLYAYLLYACESVVTAAMDLSVTFVLEPFCTYNVQKTHFSGLEFHHWQLTKVIHWFRIICPTTASVSYPEAH